MKPLPLARLLPLVLALVGAACQSGPKYPPDWKAREIEVPSDRLLWEVTVFALQKESFPVGSQMDPSTLVALSGWRYSLAPFRGQGFRERAEVRFRPIGPRRYKVEVRVQKELNMDPVRPLDISYAEWEEAPDNAEAAQVLLQRIESWVAPELRLESERAPRPRGG